MRTKPLRNDYGPGSDLAEPRDSGRAERDRASAVLPGRSNTSGKMPPRSLGSLIRVPRRLAPVDEREVYEFVWQKRISRLAAEYSMSSSQDGPEGLEISHPGLNMAAPLAHEPMEIILVRLKPSALGPN